MKKILTALALVISLMTASVSAAEFGVCTHMGLGNSYGNLENIKAAGEINAGWIRDECRWEYMQTSPGGAFRIRDKDLDYIKRVDAAGINQLLVLSYGNTSYTNGEEMPRVENTEFYNGWLSYVRYTVGQVKDYVDAYEIWNEPNLETFNYGMLGTAEDYARLYLDSKAIIEELDPTATVVCGAITGYADSDLEYGRGIFRTIAAEGNVNNLIDAFSIHSYTQLDDEKYITSLNTWEGVFDEFGYTGDVWMTENGVTSDNESGRTEAAQASLYAKLGMHWQNYLKNNSRDGVSFWYDLRNDVGISTAEDNFGLFDSTYNIKPSGQAYRAYDSFTNGKTLESLDKIKTKDYLFLEDTYGYVAKYVSDFETTYILYDNNDMNYSQSVAISGDVAYVYDSKGNQREKIDSPSGTKSVVMANEPTYVRCITYKTTIASANYDEAEGLLKISGNTNIANTVTVELLSGGVVIDTHTAQVNGGRFNEWFSIIDGGTYTVRVGYPEAEAIGKQDASAQTDCTVKGHTLPEFALSTTTSYNAAARSVSITGTVNDPVDNQYVTVLAIPASMDVNNVDLNAAAYIRQIPATDGNFEAEFTLPEYYASEMSIYLGGTDIGTTYSDNADVPDNEYVYVASLTLGKTNTLTSTATVRNFAETEKKATMIVAQYTPDKMLEHVEISEKTIPAKTYAAIECTISNVAIESGASIAKAFIWTDTSGIVPLYNFDEVSLGE